VRVSLADVLILLWREKKKMPKNWVS